ncbi:MAG: hypothetical protein H7834_13480 [Magnetococcus sp. YQC-9]
MTLLLARSSKEAFFAFFAKNAPRAALVSKSCFAISAKRLLESIARTKPRAGGSRVASRFAAVALQATAVGTEAAR